MLGGASGDNICGREGEGRAGKGRERRGKGEKGRERRKSGQKGKLNGDVAAVMV